MHCYQKIDCLFFFNGFGVSAFCKFSRPKKDTTVLSSLHWIFPLLTPLTLERSKNKVIMGDTGVCDFVGTVDVTLAS